MRIVEGADEARNTLLRRVPLEEPELPAAVRETNRRVFGAELGAAEVVDRILRDVRTEGDVAIRRYNEALDGVSGPAVPLEVPADETKAASTGGGEAPAQGPPRASRRPPKARRSGRPPTADPE